MALRLVCRTGQFPVRQSLSHHWNSKLLKASQNLSSAAAGGSNQDPFDVSIDYKTGIAVLRMNKKPVNIFTLEMLTSLTIALDELESDSGCNGLVITSGVPNIFTAGIDIQEFFKPDPARLAEFWRVLQNIWMKLYLSPLATVAAINGHSPAGGCLMALSCDYRVMSSGNYLIGLNETLLGVPLSFWIIDTMCNVVGQRQCERALQLGALYSPEDALKIGLVDKVVSDAEVFEKAQVELTNWLRVPVYARQLTKERLRKPTVQKLVGRQDEDIETLVNFVIKDSTQKSLGRYLESLKKPKK